MEQSFQQRSCSKQQTKRLEFCQQKFSEIVVPRNIIVRSSPSGWWTPNLHEEFVDTFFPVWDEDRYLFIDRFPVHTVEKFLWQLDDRDVVQVLIPGGLTGQHQPSDVAVNKLFK